MGKGAWAKQSFFKSNVISRISHIKAHTALSYPFTPTKAVAQKLQVLHPMVEEWSCRGLLWVKDQSCSWHMEVYLDRCWLNGWGRSV